MTAVRPFNDGFRVTFNQSLANCVVQATAGVGNPAGDNSVLYNGASPQVDMHDPPGTGGTDHH